TITSISAVNPSARSRKSMVASPARNQTKYCSTLPPRLTTSSSTNTDSTQAPAAARMQGQWLFCFKTEPKKAVTTAAARGSAGMSQRWSDMAGLLAVGRFGAGGRQARQRLLLRRRRQRLLVHDRLLVRLAQVLPRADVERVLAAVQD